MRFSERPGILRLAARNLLRNPGRTLAVLLGVMVVAGSAFAGGLIGRGVSFSVSRGLERLGADLMVVPEGAAEKTHTALVMGLPTAFYMEGAGRLEAIRAVEGVAAASPQIFVETLASSACCTGHLMLVGYDPETDFTVKPWLRQNLKRELAPDEVLVGNHILGVTGDPLLFYGSTFRLAARLDPTGMGMDETVFLPAPAVWEIAERSRELATEPLEIPQGHVSAILVKLEDGADAAQVAAEIERRLDGVTVITAGEIARSVADDLSVLMASLLPVLISLVLVAVLLFVILFFAIARERTREIGLLRAMGATAGQATGALVLEAGLLSALGGLAGVLAGSAVYGLFKEAIMVSYTLPFLYPPGAEQTLLAAAVVAVAAAGGVLAAAVPARRLARLEPHEAIHAH
ncbi:ABC transporter permease [Symbiobacterium thermophilum]|uniref:ABC transporter permease n=1 Tax=Symbiobacterium thermophilum TaxID=2734 RepID=UPI002356575A|nr:ABC transporter permease [Symbiobacterium thermophilum]